MKKVFFTLLAAAFLCGCAGSGSKSQQDTEAPIVLEAPLEEVLEQNIELNERLSELENELDSLLNTL